MAPHIGLTFVSGLARYARIALDSRPNLLNDISLDPDCPGPRGFTVEKRYSLFSDGWRAYRPSKTQEKLSLPRPWKIGEKNFELV
ncbi:MAG: hypothetical protein LBR11_06660 [Deltaproteobacteria bacterium]|nr:hypothetical protein [Deltaproteobacteria bacterium]